MDSALLLHDLGSLAVVAIALQKDITGGTLLCRCSSLCSGAGAFCWASWSLYAINIQRAL